MRQETMDWRCWRCGWTSWRSRGLGATTETNVMFSQELY